MGNKDGHGAFEIVTRSMKGVLEFRSGQRSENRMQDIERRHPG
jgi:hypothetical protein